MPGWWFEWAVWTTAIIPLAGPRLIRRDFLTEVGVGIKVYSGTRLITVVDWMSPAAAGCRGVTHMECAGYGQ